MRSRGGDDNQRVFETLNLRMKHGRRDGSKGTSQEAAVLV